MFTFVTSCCSPHISTSQQKSSTECLIWCCSGCVRILPFDRLRGLCHSTVSGGLCMMSLPVWLPGPMILLVVDLQWRNQDFLEVVPRTLGGGGVPTYDFTKFSQKLHEIERIWTPRGCTRPSCPPDPSLISVLGDLCRETPPLKAEKRAVCIVLECFLVLGEKLYWRWTVHCRRFCLFT